MRDIVRRSLTTHVCRVLRGNRGETGNVTHLGKRLRSIVRSTSFRRERTRRSARSVRTELLHRDRRAGGWPAAEEIIWDYEAYLEAIRVVCRVGLSGRTLMLDGNHDDNIRPRVLSFPAPRDSECGVAIAIPNRTPPSTRVLSDHQQTPHGRRRDIRKIGGIGSRSVARGAAESRSGKRKLRQSRARAIRSRAVTRRAVPLKSTTRIIQGVGEPTWESRAGVSRGNF